MFFCHPGLYEGRGQISKTDLARRSSFHSRFGFRLSSSDDDGDRGVAAADHSDSASSAGATSPHPPTAAAARRSSALGPKVTQRRVGGVECQELDWVRGRGRERERRTVNVKRHGETMIERLRGRISKRRLMNRFIDRPHVQICMKICGLGCVTRTRVRMQFCTFLLLALV